MDIAEVLHRNGRRATRPRRAVWKALVDADDHLTAEELSARVEDVEPGVNLASVYRSLALFEELDLVRESRLGDEDAGRWELAHPDEHFHVVCQRCRAVEHHVGSLVEPIEEHLADGHGFEVETVDLTVTGRCADCAGESD